MTEQQLQNYARVVIEAGIDLSEGQNVYISCASEHYDFAVQLADTAYKKGARFVEIYISGSKLYKARAENAKEEFLTFFPEYLKVRMLEQLADNWAYIRIDNTEEIELLSNTDPNRIQKIISNERRFTNQMSQALSSLKNQWTILAMPGKKWADKVFNSEDESNLTKLEDAVLKIMRLDNSDPVKAWREHGQTLHRRSLKLNSLKLDKVKFTGEGTELEIGFIENAIWQGGDCVCLNGRTIIPNLPTEEVYTTPDYRRTNGRVRVTRPVKVLEQSVIGAWFEFKDGKVVNFGADKGKQTLERYLAIDDGSSYLGECALVDCTSPIFQCGLVFNSILYDENAACHIAIGAGLSSCMPSGIDLKDEKALKSAGCNASIVHTDFMIGYEGINVMGYDKSGKEIEIIKSGKFVI